ncbi:unnamed protein product, partial [Symbiodinium sp. KB8]
VSGMSVASQAASVAGPPPPVQEMPQAQRPSAAPYVQPHSATFSTLPQEGVWHVLEPPCSLATTPNGDYRAYAHLNSKAAFKDAMTPRAKIIENMLDPIQPQCKFCDRHRGYSEHLGADKHWRALYPQYTGEGVVIAGVRPRAWNKWRVAAGFVRINELDGTIEIARGSRDPDLTDSPAEPAPAQATPDPWANYSGLHQPHPQSMQPPPAQTMQQAPQPAQPAGFPAQPPHGQPPLDWACQQPQSLHPPQPSQMQQQQQQQQQAPQPAHPAGLPAAYPPAPPALDPNSSASGVHQAYQQPQPAQPPSAQPTLDPRGMSAGVHHLYQPQSLQPQQPQQLPPPWQQ